MQKKIRTASKQKVPFVLIAGATDAEAGAVSFRYRDGSQRNGVPVDDAVAQVAAWVAGRSNVDSDRRHRRGRRRRARRPRIPCGAALTDGGPAAQEQPFERLWTPYRMAYIQGEGKPTGAHDCPFCVIPTMDDEAGLIVARGSGSTPSSTCTRTTPVI